MTLDEYFGDWMKVIDRTELNNVMAISNKVKEIYGVPVKWYEEY